MIVSMLFDASSPLRSGAAAAPVGDVDLSWHPHVSVWLVFGALAMGLWWALTRLGPRLVEPGEPVITRRQRQWLVFGLGIAFVFSEYPVHDVSERYLLLVHMLQHTVFTLVAPAAVLLGTPDWLFRWVVGRLRLGSVVRVVSAPIPAFLLFNSLVVATHWTAIVERSLHNEWWHFSVHLTIFLAALVMWMPVINRRPEFPSISKPVKIMYLFAVSLVPTIPASFLAFADRAIYPTYANAPRLFPGLDAVGDQQIAAAIMKVYAGTLLWAVMAYVFLQWWKDSQAGDAEDMRLRPMPRPSPPAASAAPDVAGDGDVLTWDQVRAELDRLEKAGAPAAAPAPDGPDR